MNLLHHPELRERLAAAYALGTLRGPARRRFETLARQHPEVRAAALVWQSRIAGLNELQPNQAPSPAVWTRIDNLIRADLERHALAQARQTAQADPASSRKSNDELVAALEQQLQASPRISYVAVLNDAQANASMLVTFDPRSARLTLQRVGGYREASDRSLQLWALPPGQPPQSLGVLGQGPLLRLTAGEDELRRSPLLAISLEPQGGVPSERGPTGPVLFKGAVIRPQL
ncbi:MAG: anti-sigma factor [Polaromonas sp.]|nr:anti-sigma factor [Polaromonas sp.]